MGSMLRKSGITTATAIAVVVASFALPNVASAQHWHGGHGGWHGSDGWGWGGFGLGLGTGLLLGAAPYYGGY